MKMKTTILFLFLSSLAFAQDPHTCVSHPCTAHNTLENLICSDSSGSGTAQSCSTGPTIFTPVSGDTIMYSTTTTNTGDVTVDVNSLGVKHIRKWQGSSVLASGDLVANTPTLLTYDGTFWEIYTIGNAPSAGGGGSSAPFLGVSSTANNGSGKPGAVLCSTSNTSTPASSYSCTATTHSGTQVLVITNATATPSGGSLTYNNIYSPSGNLASKGWWANVSSGASVTFTVAANGGSQTFGFFAVFELYAGNASNPIDNVSAEQDFTSSSSFEVTGATTANPNELMFLVTNATTCGTGTSSTSTMGGGEALNGNSVELGGIYSDGNQSATIFVRRLQATTSHWYTHFNAECSSNWGAIMFSVTH